MDRLLHINVKKRFAVALFNLLVAAIAGLLLRVLHVIHIPYLNYSNILHAHSHFAFAGWGFIALFMGFYYAFLKEEKVSGKSWFYIFLFSLIAAWGMLISFPFKGYAPVSIAFSTLYTLLTYWFAWRFYQDSGNNKKSTVSLLFARAALLFLVLSSAGPLAMGPLMALGKEGSALAWDAIYFYLHFQYNGWLIFGIITLFFKWLETNQINFSKKQALLFFRLMFWSCFPAFLLSVLWSKPPEIFFLVAGAAGFIQLVAIIPFLRIIKECKKNHDFILPVVRRLGAFVFAMFVLKSLLQFLSSFPGAVYWTVAIRHLDIGYLHLVLLGVVTFFLLAYFIQEHILKFNKIIRQGIILFITGFILTETLLFGESLFEIWNSHIPAFDLLMLISTVLLPAGILFLFADHYKILFRRGKSKNYPVLKNVLS